jgi:6-phosphogluconolactonase
MSSPQPNNPDIIILDDREALNHEAATRFVALARRAIEDRGRFMVALSGGSTPKALFELLATDEWRDQVDWSRTHLFWGDERHVPQDHADSNYRMTREALLSKVEIPAENIHRVETEAGAPDEVAAAYERTLREAFGLGADGVPRFDLIHLGLGDDGHTASMFPGTNAMHENERLVVAVWVEKFKSNRITTTPVVLNNAAEVQFLISGASKKDVVPQVIRGAYEPDRLPSQTVRPTDGALRFILDRDAAETL